MTELSILNNFPEIILFKSSNDLFWLFCNDLRTEVWMWAARLKNIWNWITFLGDFCITIVKTKDTWGCLELKDIFGVIESKKQADEKLFSHFLLTKRSTTEICHSYSNLFKLISLGVRWNKSRISQLPTTNKIKEDKIFRSKQIEINIHNRFNGRSLNLFNTCVCVLTRGEINKFKVLDIR